VPRFSFFFSSWGLFPASPCGSLVRSTTSVLFFHTVLSHPSLSFSPVTRNNGRCSSHYYTFYVSVVPAKYQSHLYGSEGSSEVPLREYVNIMEDYFKDAPEVRSTSMVERGG